jgi:sugar lactone lactonase YvrE
VTAATLTSPSGVALDAVNGKLWVGHDRRILRFDVNNLATFNSNAELVLGQSVFSSQTGGPADQRRLYTPRGMWIDRRGGLWVADSLYNRILYWNNSASITTNNAPADRVLGQANFSLGLDSTNVNRFFGPWGITIDKDDNLWVADAFNNRVLMWSNILARIDSGQNAAALTANLVLGQPNFNTNTSHPPDQGPYQPRGVAMIGNDLYVADDQYRVVRWNNAASLASGTPPNAVLGQSSLTDTVDLGGVNTDWSIAQGMALHSDADGTLYVADFFAGRVVFFDNVATKSNRAAASGVFGQADLDTRASGCSAGILGSSMGVALDYGKCQMWIADTIHNRVLRFSGQSDCSSVACAIGTPSGFDCICPSQDSQVLLSFADDHPSVTLLQGDNLNTSSTAELGVGDLISSSGQSIALPDANWTRIVAPVQSAPVGIGGSTVSGWEYSLPSSEINITLRYLHLPDQTPVQQFLDLPAVQSLGGSIKSAVSVSITNSSVLFDSASDTLSFSFTIDYTNLAFQSTSSLTPEEINGTTTLYVLTSPRGKVALQVANQAVVDGSVVDVEQIVSVVATNVDDGHIEIEIMVPYFTSTLQYDPDVSVLFTVEEDNNDDTTWLYLLTLAAIPIAVVIVVIVAVTSTVLLCVKRKMHAKQFDAALAAVNYA